MQTDHAAHPWGYPEDARSTRKPTWTSLYARTVLAIALAFLSIPVAGIWCLVADDIGGRQVLLVLGAAMTGGVLLRSWIALLLVPAAQLVGGVSAVVIAMNLAETTPENNVAELDATAFGLLFVVAAVIMSFPFVALGTAAGRSSASQSASEGRPRGIEGPASGATALLGTDSAWVTAWRCPACGRLNAAETHRCEQCGHGLLDSQAVHPPVRDIAVVEPVGSGPRVGAALIDLLVLIFAFFATFVTLAIVSGIVGLPDSVGIGLVLVLGPVVWVGYPTLMQARSGATFGQQALKLRVVSEDGSPVKGSAAFVRSLLRIVDSLFFGLLGVILIESSPRKQRLGDRAAHTIVVRRSFQTDTARTTF